MKRCHCQWPWMTPNSSFKVTVFQKGEIVAEGDSVREGSQQKKSIWTATEWNVFGLLLTLTTATSYSWLVHSGAASFLASVTEILYFATHNLSSGFFNVLHNDDRNSWKCNNTTLLTINFGDWTDFATSISTEHLVLKYETLHELQSILQHVMHRLTNALHSYHHHLIRSIQLSPY